MKNLQRYLVVFISLLMTSVPALADNNSLLLSNNSVDEILEALTVEEKVNLVIGTGMKMEGLPESFAGPAIGQANSPVAGAAGTTFAIPRLGVPSIVLADGPAGLRIDPTRDDDSNTTYYATAFPIATLLASTWDIDLVEEVGRAMGAEARDYGIDILLAPALNIHRIPLGGRNFEYYSEDPLVSGNMAAAMVRGVQSQGVGTSVKHFVANNHEWNRFTINVKTDQRSLREIYLRGFEIAIKESRPWTVMSSYNKLNGTYTSEREDLLTGILRAQWGFDGVVMTDWFAGSNPVAQMRAGNDLLMPGTAVQQAKLIEAVKSNELLEAILDRNVKNILHLILKTHTFNNYEYTNKPDLIAHAKTARTVAADGMVLLQNKRNALPLTKPQKLAIFGINAYDMATGGSGSGDVNEAYSVSLTEGLETAGFITNDDLARIYSQYIDEQKANRPAPAPMRPPLAIAERPVKLSEIKDLVKTTDIALITIGRNSGEFEDRKAKDDFYLSETEIELINDVTSVYHDSGKKVVVVLNIGGVIETSSWRAKVDAVLIAWQPGQEAGYAITDVLTGKVNPSGKLTTTFARRLDDYPAAKNFPGVMVDDVAEVTYQDGIRVGYRGFMEQDIKPAYPFGFGLSYTEFKYTGLSLSSHNFKDKIKVEVKVTNVGAIPGREVVQLYLTAPPGGLKKPERELRGFAKSSLLQPGESQTMYFELTSRDLASFSMSDNLWVATAGKYRISIGASSEDIRVSKTFDIKESVTLPL